MTLSLYFLRKFVIIFIVVMLITYSVVFVITLLESFNISAIQNQPLGKIVTLTALKTPLILSELLPFVILLAAFSFSINAMRANEFIVVRSAGISMVKIILKVSISTFSIGIVAVLFFDPFTHILRQHYEMELSSPTAAAIKIDDSGLWLRQKSSEGHLVMRASSVENNAKLFRGVTVINYDKNNIAYEYYQTDIAFLSQQQLILTNVKKWNLLTKNPENLATEIIVKQFSITITPELILSGLPKPATIFIWNLPQIIQINREGGISFIKYEMQLQAALARPLLFFIMFLLGVIFIPKSSRAANLGLAGLYALSSGFLLYSLQNFSQILGETDQIPIFIAAWFPLLIVCLLTLTLLLHREDG